MGLGYDHDLVCLSRVHWPLVGEWLVGTGSVAGMMKSDWGQGKLEQGEDTADRETRILAICPGERRT